MAVSCQCEAARLDQQFVDQRRAQRRQVDFELVARLHVDVVDEAHRRGAEEMQVHVARHGDAAGT